MKKNRKTDIHFAEAARRKEEIAKYGKIVSLRPSVAHKSKKNYDRNQHKKETSKQIDASYFFYITMIG